jgi:heme/copper-type cytochrome/quinol oxidase subunit 3
MGSELTHRPTLDVSGLPTVVFGSRSILWWATMGLAIIEGTMFAILIATYFFLRTRVGDWPPGVLPPYLLWGTINTGIFLASVVPNMLLKQAAKQGDLRKVRLGLVVLDAIGLAALMVRIPEFPSLGVHWMSNVYGSAVWTLLGFHTVHLLTDWVDSVVLTVLMFTSRVEGKRFMDVYENSDYWYFVIWTWLPVYATIYLAPRLL